MTVKKPPTGPVVWTLIDQQTDGPDEDGEITFHCALGVTDGRTFFVSVCGPGTSARVDFTKAAQAAALALSSSEVPSLRVH